jgi:hypothetical protein
MYNTSSSPVLTNVTITGNRAVNGGGMYNNTSSPVLTNVTMAAISECSGGGMFNLNSSASLRIRNSIIWGNAGTNPGIYNNNSSATVTYSIVENGHQATGTDPLFVTPEPAANAPTTAGNYHLQPGSPAIDAGDNGLYPPNTYSAWQTTWLSGLGLPTDLVPPGVFTTRIVPALEKDLGGVNDRIRNGTTGMIIDMGAYEY